MSIWKELSKPFDPQNLKWRIQNVNNDETSALVIAYGDSRDYEKRLDNVVGPENWETESTVKTSDSHAVVAVETTIHTGDGSVTKSQVGEEVVKYGQDVNENAYTTAFAQAFKRSVSAFGLSYLYELDDIWVELDEDNPFDHDFQSKYKGTWYGFDRPNLPDWAKPNGNTTSTTNTNSSSESKSDDDYGSVVPDEAKDESESSSDTDNEPDGEIDTSVEIDFGKQEGTPINEVESWYLEWMVSEDNFEEDDIWYKRAKKVLENRKDKEFQAISSLIEELSIDPNVIIATCQEVYDKESRDEMLHTEVEEIREHLQQLKENDEAPMYGDNNALVALKDEE